MTEVIVIGLGAMGSAAVYQLAKRGISVIGIDRFHPPHDQGSSHGDTRITRQGIGEGSDYSPLAIRSHEIWRELEAVTGDQLLLACGFLAIDSTGGLSPMHGKPDFIDAAAASASRYGITHELLSPKECEFRFPQFLLRGEEKIYFEPGGGLVFPERCIAAQLQQARRFGATLRTGETVTAITPDGDGVRVDTLAGVHRAARVIVSAGGWTPGLVGERLSRTQLLRQVLHWYPPKRVETYRPGAMPTFIWLHGLNAEDSFYGFPWVPGFTPAVKVAREQYSIAAGSPEAIDRSVRAEEGIAMYRDHLMGRMEGIEPNPIRSEACFYTYTPDGDFVIDFHPADEKLLVVSACSGHGFKHSAGVGAHVADIIEGHAAPLEVFDIDRGAMKTSPQSR